MGTKKLGDLGVYGGGRRAVSRARANIGKHIRCEYSQIEARTGRNRTRTDAANKYVRTRSGNPEKEEGKFHGKNAIWPPVYSITFLKSK